MARQLVVIEFDRSGLHAVEVAMTRAGVRLLGATSAARPAGVAADDPEATGKWIRASLDAAGLRSRRLRVGLPRDAAAVKRPLLPAASEDELPGMVALAVDRDLPFDAGDAIIDFIRLPAARRSPDPNDPRPAGAPAGRPRRRLRLPALRAKRSTPTATSSSSSSTPSTSTPTSSRSSSAAPIRILAAAIDRRRLESVRATVSAAGRTLDGVTLRSLGLANLLARLREVDAGGDDVDTAAGRELILDVGDRGLEVLVLDAGGVRFARAVPLPAATGDPHARIADILTEARRTWLSYRVAGDAGDADAAVVRATVLGPPALAEPLERGLRDLLDVPVRRLDPRAAAGGDPAIAARVLEAGGWPLVGLVLPAAEGRIDWTRPRRTPDRRRAMVRRAGLLAALLVIVAGGVWSYARRDLADLRGQLASLQDGRREIAGDYARLQRDIARRIHLERWTMVHPRWLEHLAFVEASMPPPGDVVLDGVTGSLAYRGVDFDRREREWSAPYELTLVVEGEAITRAAAESLRGAFVEAEVYRVSSTGGDGRAGRRLPIGFTYRLGTRDLAPPRAVSPVVLADAPATSPPPPTPTATPPPPPPPPPASTSAATPASDATSEAAE